jgi:hypothetical protein
VIRVNTNGSTTSKVVLLIDLDPRVNETVNLSVVFSVTNSEKLLGIVTLICWLLLAFDKIEFI